MNSKIELISTFEAKIAECRQQLQEATPTPSSDTKPATDHTLVTIKFLEAQEHIYVTVLHLIQREESLDPIIELITNQTQKMDLYQNSSYLSSKGWGAYAEGGQIAIETVLEVLGLKS